MKRLIARRNRAHRGDGPKPEDPNRNPWRETRGSGHGEPQGSGCTRLATGAIEEKCRLGGLAVLLTRDGVSAPWVQFATSPRCHCSTTRAQAQRTKVLWQYHRQYETKSTNVQVAVANVRCWYAVTAGAVQLDCTRPIGTLITRTQTGQIPLATFLRCAPLATRTLAHTGVAKQP